MPLSLPDQNAPGSQEMPHTHNQEPTKLNNTVRLCCWVLLVPRRQKSTPAVLTAVLLCTWTSNCADHRGMAGPSPRSDAGSQYCHAHIPVRVNGVWVPGHWVRRNPKV